MPKRSSRKYSAAGIGAFLLAAFITAFLFINFCDLVYQCGCRSWWSGAADRCNIHNAQPPHCPWCLDGGAWGYATFGLIIVSQALVALTVRSWGFGLRLLAALLVFPALGGLAALLLGWYTGYWGG